jgi:uncharacterized protein GlcG (DUF336 family)
MRRISLIVCSLVLLSLPAAAQTADRKVITLDGAKAILAAAEAEAAKNKWTVAIAVVDESGNLSRSTRSTTRRSGASTRYRRPDGRVDEASHEGVADAVAGGRTVMLAVEGHAAEGGGGVLDGRVIGAVGVSGVTSQQDAQVAQAGAAALKK